MAFMRTGSAVLVRPGVTKTEWANIRTAGKGVRVASGDLEGNLIDRASEMLQRPFNPKDYLLSHATIIASVDVLTPPGAKTGSIMIDGRRVNRKFADFRVTQNTQKYLNNNWDGWSRGVLAKAYPTFVGGHNFCEHVQIEELSKGRIIDAVARDIGDSLYVDILIATDRVHTDLIRAIQAGEMSTLSMGCTVTGTICTKCGHWAADETEICNCIKYMKGNTFYDDQGQSNIVAELCGHESLAPTGGVYFVEGSWVGTPAFTGAVLRNIVDMSPANMARAAAILSTPPPQWSADQMLKAASADGKIIRKYPADARLAEESSRTADNVIIHKFEPASVKELITHRYATGSVEDIVASEHLQRIAKSDPFLSGWMDDVDAPAEADAPADGGEEEKAPANPMEDTLKELEDHMLSEVSKRVRDRMRKKDVEEALGTDDASAPNDSLVKQASTYYRAGLDALVRTASCDAALVNGVAVLNQQVGINVPVPVYRAALKMGRSDQYRSKDAFLGACQKALGHKPSPGETRTILRITKLLARKSGESSIQAVAKENDDE